MLNTIKLDSQKKHHPKLTINTITVSKTLVECNFLNRLSSPESLAALVAGTIT